MFAHEMLIMKMRRLERPRQKGRERGLQKPLWMAAAPSQARPLAFVTKVPVFI